MEESRQYGFWADACFWFYRNVPLKNSFGYIKIPFIQQMQEYQKELFARFSKYVFLKIYQYSQENSRAGVSFK